MRKRKLPKFKSEKQERRFWDQNSPLDFMDDFKDIKLSMTNLKPSTKTMTIRMPSMLMEELKVIANKKDIPYQSLIKAWLSERVEKEQKV